MSKRKGRQKKHKGQTGNKTPVVKPYALSEDVIQLAGPLPGLEEMETVVIREGSWPFRWLEGIGVNVVSSGICFLLGTALTFWLLHGQPEPTSPPSSLKEEKAECSGLPPTQNAGVPNRVMDAGMLGAAFEPAKPRSDRNGPGAQPY